MCFHRYMVELKGEETGRTYMYLEEAQDPKTAFIQARLRHAGKFDRLDVYENADKHYNSKDVHEV
jgi:hypothetical protein